MKRNFAIVSKILFDVKQFVRKLLYGRAYRADKKAYIKDNRRKNFEYHKRFEMPFYKDRYQEAGALGAIQRVLKASGKAYIAVPIGKKHLEFNAHRVFYVQTIVDCFSDMKLLEFSTVHGLEDYIKYNIDIHRYDREEDNGGGLRFGLLAFENK